MLRTRSNSWSRPGKGPPGQSRTPPGAYPPRDNSAGAEEQIMIAGDRIHSFRNAVLAALVASGAAALVGAVTAAPAGAASRTTPSSTTTVKVVETDFHIALSKKTFTAARYAILIVSKGATH